MHATRFDAVTRSLAMVWSRRDLVAALGAALAPGLRAHTVAAHDPTQKCRRFKGKRKKQRKKCLKKARAHNARHAARSPIDPGPECLEGTKPCDGTCIPTDHCCAKEDCPDSARRS